MKRIANLTAVLLLAALLVCSCATAPQEEAAAPVAAAPAPAAVAATPAAAPAPAAEVPKAEEPAPAAVEAVAVVEEAPAAVAEVSEQFKAIVTIPSTSNEWFTKYGNVNFDFSVADFFALGFEEGDIVKVSFLGQEVVLPVVPTYSYVDSGLPAVMAYLDGEGNPFGNLAAAINMGNFAEVYGIATKTTNADKTYFWTAKEGVTAPVTLTITMVEKGGYISEYILHDLNRTNAREDYAALSDEEFANFRQVKTTGMGNHLFRSSSPINPEIGRNTYADAAIKAAGVKVIINLADSRADAYSYEGFSSSYYSKQSVTYLNLGVDFQADEFKKGLEEGLRVLAARKTNYMIHCTEGKDRAGFVIALLECLMGASADEIVADYMVTYYNYYGIEAGTDKYDAIANSNIVKSLKAAFEVEDIYTADLAAEAADYILSIGLTEAELADLKANLARQ